MQTHPRPSRLTLPSRDLFSRNQWQIQMLPSPTEHPEVYAARQPTQVPDGLTPADLPGDLESRVEFLPALPESLTVGEGYGSRQLQDKPAATISNVPGDPPGTTMECHFAEMAATPNLGEMAPEYWTENCDLNFVFSSPMEMATKVPIEGNACAAPAELPAVAEHNTCDEGLLPEDATSPTQVVAITIPTDVSASRPTTAQSVSAKVLLPTPTLACGPTKKELERARDLLPQVIEIDLSPDPGWTVDTCDQRETYPPEEQACMFLELIALSPCTHTPCLPGCWILTALREHPLGIPVVLWTTRTGVLPRCAARLCVTSPQPLPDAQGLGPSHRDPRPAESV